MQSTLAIADDNFSSSENTSGEELPVELRAAVIAQIKTIFDPEIPVNIYELGLIYEIEIDAQKNVTILMTLTSPSCPVAGSLPGDVERKVRDVPDVQNVHVALVWDPPWNQERMSEVAKLELGYI